MEDYYDIAIVGAGPAGNAAALRLAGSGLKVVLLDKDQFPREKVCGDAVAGLSERILKDIVPDYEQLYKGTQHVKMHDTLLYLGAYKAVNFSWVRSIHTISRLEFDNALLQRVKRSEVEVREGFVVKEVRRAQDGFFVKSKDGEELHSRLLIGCDGVHSAVARSLAPRDLKHKNDAVAVRAYFKNMTALEYDRLEVFFFPKFFPGYLWVFPLPDNRANVGFGLTIDGIKDSNIKLKETTLSLLDQHPRLRELFQNAELVGDLKGYGLPMSSQKVQRHGDGFMLCGDAGALVDPLSGEGIGNALISGKLAAEVAMEAFKANDLSAAFLGQYVQHLRRELKDVMIQKPLLLSLIRKQPWLVNFYGWLLQSKFARNTIKKWL